MGVVHTGILLVRMKTANLDTFLKEEFIEMSFDLEAKSVYTFKGIEYYWINEKKNVTKYPKLCATLELVLQAFPSSYMTESGFSHVHYLQSR